MRLEPPEPSLQRARGRAEVAVAQRGGRTRLARLFQEGSAKAILPRVHGPAPEAVLINTAGGVTGGDRLAWRLEAGAGAALVGTTQAAERVYRSLAGAAQIETQLVAGPGASLEWLPQETILFEAGRLDRRLDAAIAADAALSLLETVVLGRAAMGERVAGGAISDQWRIRRNGRLVHAEALRAEGDLGRATGGPATLAGARAFATFVHVAPGAEARLDKPPQPAPDAGQQKQDRPAGPPKQPRPETRPTQDGGPPAIRRDKSGPPESRSPDTQKPPSSPDRRDQTGKQRQEKGAAPQPPAAPAPSPGPAATPETKPAPSPEQRTGPGRAGPGADPGTPGGQPPGFRASPPQAPATQAPATQAPATQAPPAQAPAPQEAPAAQAPAGPAPTATPQNVRRLDDFRSQRRESREGNRTVIQEPGRTIVREGDRTIIRRNEAELLRRGAQGRAGRASRRRGPHHRRAAGRDHRSSP